MVKKFFLFLLAVVVAAATPTAIAKDKKGGVNDYNIEGAGTGTQGTYLVKVTVITKDKKVSDDAIKRAAVHGVLFRGFTDTTVRRTQKPLAGSIANEDVTPITARSFSSRSTKLPRYCSDREYSLKLPGSWRYSIPDAPWKKYPSGVNAST